MENYSSICQKWQGRLTKTILIGVKNIEIGREIELNYKYNKDKWGFIANEKSKEVNGKLLKSTLVSVEVGERGA